MKKLLSFQIFLIICLSLLLACNKQQQTNLPEEYVENTPQATTPAKPTTDRLFFIEGQLCQHLRNIFQDSKGNLWFGTNVYGLMRYDGDSLVYFDKNNGLERNGRFTGIAEESEGHLWFAAYGGLLKYDGNTFKNYAAEEGLIDNELWSLLIDRKGIIWIGGTEGLYRFDGESFTPFSFPKANVPNPEPQYAENLITSLLEDRRGKIWIGTDGYGLTVFDPSDAQDSFTHYTKAEGLADNTIGGLLEDKDGNIWIGTVFGGLSRFDGKHFKNFTAEGIIEGIEVGGLHQDRKGDIWFTAENHGAYRFDGDSFHKYSQAEGLPTNALLAIYEDRESRFWFGGWGGLFRFDGESFQPVSKEGPWE